MEYKVINNDEAKKLSAIELLKSLDSTEQGLPSSSIDERRSFFGYNEINEKKSSPILIFLKFFWGPIPWMIELAIILSAVLNDPTDFIIISILLLFNAVVGFFQEYQADNAIELLKNHLALNSRVLRDNKWSMILARELVPGDVIRIRLGEIVPADVKLIGSGSVLLDESSLTGESLPVDKKKGDIAYSGTITKQGEAEGIVYATGSNTFFGKTTHLVASTKVVSHFQKAVLKIGNFLIVLAILLAGILLSVEVFFFKAPFLTILRFALILTVAAIPAALPVVLSVTLAVGAVKLAKKKTIVSNLTSIEELAGIDILCSDKTGTLTKNELTVNDIIPIGSFNQDDVIKSASLASRQEDNDSIDLAILDKLHENDDLTNKLTNCNVTDFKPFDPINKRTEATVSENNTSYSVSKGAPQVILALLPNKESIEQKVNDIVEELATKGHRALGVARTNTQGQWEFVGLFSLYDPPRDDSAETIQMTKDLDIRVKMVTGDHVSIAREIGDQIGIGRNIHSVSEFKDKSDADIEKLIESVDGFAEVYPEHKYKIVDTLQKYDHIVGMTGDGVNDAPALKRADVGIAVAGATDAAKSSADIILTEPGLSVITEGIVESRKIFHRMNTYAIYRIAETVRVLFFIVLATILFKQQPITALMIVLLALFNDAPIMAIAYDNVQYSKKREQWHMNTVLEISSILGTVGVMFSFGAYAIGIIYFKLPIDVLQAFIFLKLAVAGHLTVFMARTKDYFWSKPLPSSLLFWSAVATKALATIIVVYGFFVSPIGWGLAIFVWLYAFLELFVTDFIKVQAYKYLHNVHFNRQVAGISKVIHRKHLNLTT